MKKIFSLIVVLIPLIASAQDRIFFRDGRVTEVKVLTIFPEYVEYVRFDNQSGPHYRISKDNLKQIVYENGKTDVFHKQETAKIQSDTEISDPVPALSFGGAMDVQVKKGTGKGYKRKESRFGLNLMSGLAMFDFKSSFLGSVLGTAPGYYEIFKELYANTPGASLGLEVSYDFYLKKEKPWYLGVALGVYGDMAKGRLKYDTVKLIDVTIQSGTALALVWCGQQFKPSPRPGGNFYWKAGLGAGISFAPKGTIEVDYEGYTGNNLQTVKGDDIGFQMRGLIEAGFGNYSFRAGLRYTPGFTPFINVIGSESKFKSLHVISFVANFMF